MREQIRNKKGVLMGLTVMVGILADLIEHDEEAAEWKLEDFEELNAVLESRDLPVHTEPEECEVWSEDALGYYGLHALREVAALIWKGKPIPQNAVLTGQETEVAYELSNTALPHLRGRQRESWFKRVLLREQEDEPPPFMHLVMHSDAEGYYLPVDFPIPLLLERFLDSEESIWPLGSVQRLQDEIRILKDHLEIPDDLRLDDRVLTEFVENQSFNALGPLWQAQPIATHTALLLEQACTKSIATGAAIAFM